MAAKVDAHAYMQPEPHHQAHLQMGFAPSPRLDTALRGFLLPEQSLSEAGDSEKKAHVIGEIVLRSFMRQSVGYTHSDDGLRYFQEGELAAEQRRLSRLQNDLINVVDLSLALADNSDMVVTLHLRPTLQQRRQLSGPVLGDLVEQGVSTINVYKRFDHRDLKPDRGELIRHAADMKRTLTNAGQAVNTASPSLYFVKSPQIIPADAMRPTIGK